MKAFNRRVFSRLPLVNFIWIPFALLVKVTVFRDGRDMTGRPP